jgi:hypothetical protein
LFTNMLVPAAWLVDATDLEVANLVERIRNPRARGDQREWPAELEVER